jgi:GGDEF domain-containing protein
MTHGFLFADLRAYSQFADQHGDAAAATLLERYRRLVRGIVARYDGAEIRTEGDSFYVVFPSASSAITAGMAILSAGAISEPPLRIGIGVQAGEAAETTEGPVGTAVNVAARLCARAAAGELLVSDTVRALARTAVPFAFVRVGNLQLKGIAESVVAYRVVSSQDAETIAGTSGIRRRMGRRPVSVVAVSIVVVVAAIVGAQLLQAGIGGAGASNGTSGTGGTSSPTDLSGAEADLVARLPLHIRDHCMTSTPADAGPRAAASVTCPLPADAGATVVTYDLYDPLPLLLARFADVRRTAGDPDGECSTSPMGAEPWAVGGRFSGQVVCYQREGMSHIAWTYESGDGQGLMARARRDDGDWEELYAWWNATAAYVLR